jgi:hypothetical protein
MLSQDESSSSPLDELCRLRVVTFVSLRPIHPSETINNEDEKNLKDERNSSILDRSSLSRLITGTIKKVRHLKYNY